MFTPQDFVTCVQENLKAKGFGHKRIKEITDEYDGRVLAYTQQGKDVVSAATLAMKDQFDNMAFEGVERAKRSAKMISVQVENQARIKAAIDIPTSGLMMDGKMRGSKGVAAARGAIATIEGDPRIPGGNYNARKDVLAGQMLSLFGATLEHFGKGAFGRQKNKAHLPNIIREVFGDATGDVAAREFAEAWLKVADLGVDLFNQAGGSMRKLERYLPQGQNAVKIVKATKQVWVDDHMSAVDWSKTTWPNGTAIEPGERQSVLEHVFDTLSTDGANKIDTNAFRGRGKAVGNALENHRFLHYKDADAWLNMQNRYGDGTIFDAFTRHVDQMAHQTALVETFGPNPELTAQNMSSIVRKTTAGLSAKDKADAEAVLKNKFNPMMETVLRANPMDPHSNMGAAVTGTANILTSAMLGSSSLLAIPGDFMQTAVVRALNGMGMFDGMHYYMKALATDKKFMSEIATQSGFVHDEVVMSTYAQTRFTGLATYGPGITRNISEATMRLSLLSGHTKAARWAVQAEFMGMMERSRSMAFDDLPFKSVMERYGIGADEWDALRNNVAVWSPRKDVKFMRPIDVLQSQLPNKQLLFSKFQGMIFDEARNMIPEATMEAAVALKGTSRPDTLVGAMLHSFSMYKNFPVSFMMIYGRLGMSSPNAASRVKFFAGLGAGMMLVGAMGTQMRELTKGREPLPMATPAFLGKSLLAGGAMGIWGDFLFSGINQYGGGPKDTAAGPLISLLGDTTQLALGDTFQFADHIGGLSDKDFKSTTAAKAVEFAKRYTPGSSVWWARLVLEREVFDRLSEIADPKTYAKNKRKVAKQKQTYGNDYWFAPGDRLPK